MLTSLEWADCTVYVHVLVLTGFTLAAENMRMNISECAYCKLSNRKSMEMRSRACVSIRTTRHSHSSEEFTVITLIQLQTSLNFWRDFESRYRGLISGKSSRVTCFKWRRVKIIWNQRASASIAFSSPAGGSRRDGAHQFSRLCRISIRKILVKDFWSRGNNRRR